MKIIELKENEPLEVIKVTKRITLPACFYKDDETKTKEFEKVKMRIFTDGEIAKETKETFHNINECYIGRTKYQGAVDTLRTKNLYFKNHSFVIVYLIAEEYMTIGNVAGCFDVIKDISIYLENKKDKKALKSAKRIIKEIANLNKGIDYSSLLGMFFSESKKSVEFETEEISKNVYSLKKTK